MRHYKEIYRTRGRIYNTLFFITYKLAEYVIVSHYPRIESLVGANTTAYLVHFLSIEENEVL
jgi:hypothetical protein